MTTTLRASISGGTPLTGTVMLASEGGGGVSIDDANVSTTTAWSSSKIREELDAINVAGCPIEYVESLDTSNLVQLRDLETGPKVLYGYFSPYPNSDTSMIFDNTIVIVSRKTAGSHLMVLTGLNSKINFLEILVDDTVETGFTYTRTDFNLLEMHGLIARVEALEAAGGA